MGNFNIQSFAGGRIAVLPVLQQPPKGGYTAVAEQISAEIFMM